MSAELVADLRSIDAELATAITCTQTELWHVQQLLALRGPTQALVTDELEVLARLADLKIQAGVA